MKAEGVAPARLPALARRLDRSLTARRRPHERRRLGPPGHAARGEAKNNLRRREAPRKEPAHRPTSAYAGLEKAAAATALDVPLWPRKAGRRGAAGLRPT